MKKEKLNQMRSIKYKKDKYPNISTPEFESPFKKRDRIDMSKTKLAKYQTTKLITPFAEKNHPMRVHMYNRQLTSMVMPIETEVPSVLSALEADMLSRSNYVRRCRGTITLLGVCKYQFRKIYLYDLNGTIDILDTYGFDVYSGPATIKRTDLDLLEIGVPYDISSDDDNFTLYYPEQYKPEMDIMTYGRNVRMISTINAHTVGDACAVSEDFVEKFTTIKRKDIDITLTDNQMIKSDYPDIIPNIGHMIEKPVIFKVSEKIEKIIDNGNSSLPAGQEETAYVCDRGSMITYFEVISNKPCTDDRLEKYRKEYLDFRDSVYRMIYNYLNDNGRWSITTRSYYEHFKINQFRTSDKILRETKIRMHLITIYPGIKGTKYTNRSGAKATVQSIYPTGTYRDERGNNIDMLFPVTAHVGRMITGLLYENYVTATLELICDLIREGCVKDGADVPTKDLIELLRNVVRRLCLNRVPKLSDKDIIELLKVHKILPIAILPYESNITLKEMSELYEEVERVTGKTPMQTVSVYNPDGTKSHELSSKHSVGTVYVIRDSHDAEFGNSSISTSIKSTQGLPESKNYHKVDGKSIVGKKAVKQDVQFMAHVTGMVLDHDLQKLTYDDDESLHSVSEMLNAIGAKVRWSGDDE